MGPNALTPFLVPFPSTWRRRRSLSGGSQRTTASSTRLLHPRLSLERSGRSRPRTRPPLVRSSSPPSHPRLALAPPFASSPFPPSPSPPFPEALSEGVYVREASGTSDDYLPLVLDRWFQGLPSPFQTPVVLLISFLLLLLLADIDRSCYGLEVAGKIVGFCCRTLLDQVRLLSCLELLSSLRRVRPIGKKLFASTQTIVALASSRSCCETLRRIGTGSLPPKRSTSFPAIFSLPLPRLPSSSQCDPQALFDVLHRGGQGQEERSGPLLFSRITFSLLLSSSPFPSSSLQELLFKGTLVNLAVERQQLRSELHELEDFAEYALGLEDFVPLKEIRVPVRLPFLLIFLFFLIFLSSPSSSWSSIPGDAGSPPREEYSLAVGELVRLRRHQGEPAHALLGLCLLPRPEDAVLQNGGRDGGGVR